MSLHIGFQSVPYSQSSAPGSAHELPLPGVVAGQAGTSEPIGPEASPEASGDETEPVEPPPSAVVMDVHASGGNNQMATHLKSTWRG